MRNLIPRKEAVTLGKNSPLKIFSVCILIHLAKNPMTTKSVRSKSAHIRIKITAKQHQRCSFHKIKLLGPRDIFVACLKLQSLSASSAGSSGWKPDSLCSSQTPGTAVPSEAEQFMSAGTAQGAVALVQMEP